LIPQGFVAPGARITHPELRMGRHVYLGHGCVIYSTNQGGPVELEDRVQIYGHAFIETGAGGSIRIGEGTHIQPGCHLHAYISGIHIGKKVEIAPGCGFYCYDHGMTPGILIMEQPLISKGDITVGDGAWIGYGVTVLQGVTIGEGAVVAAGAVVTRDVPANAIAAGVPAKIIGSRSSAI
jgi:acetyltransferase-like isoleucine patch superfamily enzyme